MASGRRSSRGSGAEQLLELEFQLERVDRQRDRTRLRDRFESALKSRVEKLVVAIGLSDAQQKKLAARGSSRYRAVLRSQQRSWNTGCRSSEMTPIDVLRRSFDEIKYARVLSRARTSSASGSLFCEGPWQHPDEGTDGEISSDRATARRTTPPSGAQVGAGDLGPDAGT